MACGLSRAGSHGCGSHGRVERSGSVWARGLQYICGTEECRMSVPLCMSVSIWLVLPCVWASLGQLWVKIRGISIDVGAIILGSAPAGRKASRASRNQNVPANLRGRIHDTPQDHEIVACGGPRHRCRRERGVCLPDRTGRVWCLQCGTRPRRAACDRRRAPVGTDRGRAGAATMRSVSALRVPVAP